MTPQPKYGWDSGEAAVHKLIHLVAEEIAEASASIYTTDQIEGHMVKEYQRLLREEWNDEGPAA